jgi:hypothetical protein
MRKEDDPSLSLLTSPGHAAAEPGTSLDAGQDSAPGSGLDARYEQLRHAVLHARAEAFGDVDLLADDAAAAELIGGLLGAVARDEAPWDRGDVRASRRALAMIGGVEVEILVDVEAVGQSDVVVTPNLDQVDRVIVAGRPVPVLPLSTMLALLEATGRRERAEMVREAVTRGGLGSYWTDLSRPEQVRRSTSGGPHEIRVVHPPTAQTSVRARDGSWSPIKRPFPSALSCTSTPKRQPLRCSNQPWFESHPPPGRLHDAGSALAGDSMPTRDDPPDRWTWRAPRPPPSAPTSRSSTGTAGSP